MPNPSKTRRVLSINGQEYIVADSVKSELLMQLLDLFSAELLKPAKEEYLYVVHGDGYRYEYVLVEQGAAARPAGLAVSRRELLTEEDYSERVKACDGARAAREKAVTERTAGVKRAEEAAKNGK